MFQNSYESDYNLDYVAGGVVLTGREPAAFLVRVT